MHLSYWKAVAFGLLLISGPSANATAFKVKRGVALGDPFVSYSPKKPGMVFGDPQVLVERKVLSKIKAAGFDMVRLPVSPRLLLEREGEARVAAIREVEAGVRLILASGLRVLVDMHVGGGGQPWQNAGLTRSPDDQNFRRYLDVAEAVGRMVAGFDPAQVALEPFNEPPSPCRWTDRPDWPAFQAALYQRIRSVAPRVTLLLTGACWGSWDGLTVLNPKEFDANTLYSFHFYHPHIFTHQGTQENLNAGYYVSGLAWPPADANVTKEVLDRALKAIAVAPIPEEQRKIIARQAVASLDGYRADLSGPESLTKRVNAVRDWALRNQISPERIIVGEFGVTKDMKNIVGAAPADRVRWFRAARSAFEKAGFGWIAWNYHYQGGLIVGDVAGPLDPEIMQALGMNTGP